jgi:hypothetical protein
MKRIMIVSALLSVLALYCTGCIGCGCTPPTMFAFILDSAGTNVNARYKGIQLRYELEGRKVFSDMTTGGGAVLGRYHDTTGFAFASMNILELVQKNNLKKIELVYNDSVMANITLQVHKEFFNKNYIIDEATLNGKPIRFEVPGPEFTYILRLWQ